MCGATIGVRIIPRQAILWHQSDVLQFNSILPLSSAMVADPAREGLSPTRRHPTSFQLPVASPVVTGASDPQANDQRNPRPPLWIRLICERDSEFTETFYLLDRQLIINGCNSGTTRWKRGAGQGTGKEYGAPTPSEPTLSPSPPVHQPGRSPILSF